MLAGSKNGYFSTKLQVCTGKADSREKALGAKDVKELTAHLAALEETSRLLFYKQAAPCGS